MSTCAARTVKACDGETLRLSCISGSVIRISSGIVGDSDSYDWYGSSCVERSTDCKNSISSYRLSRLRTSCDRQTSCWVTAQRINLVCWYTATNEYEEITYDCVGKLLLCLPCGLFLADRT